MKTEVGGPATLPGQVLIARLGRTHCTVSHIVAKASEQFHMFVVGNGGVAGSSAAERNLGIGEPVPCWCCEVLVAQVPHKSNGSEHTPAVVLSETGRAVCPYGAFEIIFVRITVLAPAEEGHAGIVRVGITAPGCHSGCESDVGEQVVGLSLACHREAFCVIIFTLLTEHKGEIMYVR